MTQAYDQTIVDEIIASHDARPEMLVQILNDVLQRIGWIPDGVIRQLAGALNLSRADIHGVVSFYHDYRRSPPGKHVIKVCQAEACQAMGSRKLTQHIENRFGLKLHDGNNEVTLEPTYCLGNCALSPAIMIDNRTYGRVTPARFDDLAEAVVEAE